MGLWVPTFIYTCMSSFIITPIYSSTVEPLIKDTLNKGHLPIKDTFELYNGNTSERGQPLYNGQNDRPNVSVIPLYYNLMRRASFAMSQHFVYLG